MSGVASAIAGAAVVGAGASIYGADKAAKAQKKGQQAAIAAQQAQYAQTRGDLAPWRQKGGKALDRLDAYSSGDGSVFRKDPGYNFVRSEGQRDIGNSFAAKGGAFGGNALRALDTFNQGVASNQVDNWWNRQMGLAGMGQNAAAQTGTFGANAANNISQGYSNIGDARASGIIGATNGISSSISNGVNNWMYYRSPAGGGGGGGASWSGHAGGPM